jgi:DNA-binding NtrC family response regulator
MPTRLIWITDATEFFREEERIRRVFESAPVDLVVTRPGEFTKLVFRSGDTVLIDDAERPSMHESVEYSRSAKPTPAILLRSKLTSGSVAFAGEFSAGATLDGHEGLELTKSRVLAAIARSAKMVATPGDETREPAPAWRRSLIGHSRAIQRVAEVVRLVGPRRCTVLITGETGTGKEVAARAIHMAGPRNVAPFVALNCSAVPSTLLESELFGHTRGAFTGAAQLRIGRFEQAQCGTLFLDEIGDMPMELQAKLLRVLQEREFQRLGSSETVRVDARVIAATNHSLRHLVSEGLFREDLYYRLNVVPLELPPLRAHMSDLRSLAEHFLEKICLEEQIGLKRLSPDAWAGLEAYDWPGNIRQLENTISSAVILSENRLYLDVEDFTLPSPRAGGSETGQAENFALPENGLDFTETVNAIERSLLSQALRKTGGNKKAAAEMLRLKRTTLSAKVRVLEVGQQVA